MAERRIGLIPYAETQIRHMPEMCALLVTDQRTVVVFGHPKGTSGISLRQVFMGNPGIPAGDKNHIDFQTVNIDHLALSNDNISLPHAQIASFTMGKDLGGYFLKAIYRFSDRRMWLEARISPHPDLMKRRKVEGRKAADIRRDYAERSAAVYRRALPVAVAQAGEWKV